MVTTQLSTSASGLAYRRSGSGPTVVLLHGIPGSGAAWSAVVDQLGEDVDLIVVDLLGFGGSERPRRLDELHVQAQAAAVQQLLEELGPTSFTLVGHDFGAPVAVTVGQRCGPRVHALVLVAGNVFPDVPVPFPLSLTRLPLVGRLADLLLFSEPSLRMVLRQGTGPGGTAPDPQSHLGDAGQRRSIATIFGGSLRGLRELYAPVEDALRGLTCPVTVLWGDADPFFPPEQGARTAEAAQGSLTLLHGAGHFVPHERPADVAEAVRAAVRSACPER